MVVEKGLLTEKEWLVIPKWIGQFGVFLGVSFDLKWGWGVGEEVGKRLCEEEKHF